MSSSTLSYILHSIFQSPVHFLYHFIPSRVSCFFGPTRPTITRILSDTLSFHLVLVLDTQALPTNFSQLFFAHYHQNFLLHHMGPSCLQILSQPFLWSIFSHLPVADSFDCGTCLLTYVVPRYFATPSITCSTLSSIPFWNAGTWGFVSVHQLKLDQEIGVSLGLLSTSYVGWTHDVLPCRAVSVLPCRQSTMHFTFPCLLYHRYCPATSPRWYQ